MFSPFDTKFGTVRGFVRLMLDNIAMYAGLYRKYETIDWSSVRRLVFVCQGNICRSPYAHWLALRETDAVASLGLNTETGMAAYDMALDVARISGVDLTQHRTTDWTDFDLRDGDLLLAMEMRHIRIIEERPVDCHIQVGLLGLWCRPRLPLLYDPHRLSRAYFATCYERIDRAVARLTGQFAHRTVHAPAQNTVPDDADTESSAISP
jgi:protein-tyrosine phosphatase